VSTACSNACTARRAFIRELMEYPTSRLDHTSLTAHMYTLPSRVRCSVMSVSHSWFGPVAVKSRWTRSSCAGGPGRPFFERFLPNTLHHALPEQIAHAVRSHMSCPASRASSASSRYPNSGSSRCASNNAFARCAATHSASVTGLASHR
jgi:hypothetical protein